VPEVVAVKVEVHVAEAVVPAKVHVVNDPVTPVWVSATVPVGVVGPVAEVSMTVAVHVELWPMITGLVHVTVVVVVWTGEFTTMLAVPLLKL